MSGRRTGRRIVCAALALAAFAGAPAASEAGRWERPLQLGQAGSLLPRVQVGGRGTTHVLAGRRGSRVDAVRVRWGARRRAACRVRGVERRSPDYFSVPWSVSPAGATVVGWTQGRSRTRAHLSWARPGRCFARTHAVSPRTRDAVVGSVRVGASRTLLTTWHERLRGGASRTAWASGPIGRRPVRRGVVLPPRGPDSVSLKPPDLIAGDRVVWTWSSREYPAGFDDRRRIDRLWGATSAARGRAIPRARSLARTATQSDEAAFSGARVVTTGRGGQVALWNDERRTYVMARRPGRRFARPTALQGGGADETAPHAEAGNRAGDAVFAWTSWDDRLYALVRRRDGRMIGPQRIMRVDYPRVVHEPVVAIDGKGRAIVAWRVDDGPPGQLAAGEVRVAIAGRPGRFGRSRVVSGPRKRLEAWVDVAVDQRGRAAVVWTRNHLDSQLNIARSEVWLTRSRLGR